MYLILTTILTIPFVWLSIYLFIKSKRQDGAMFAAYCVIPNTILLVAFFVIYMSGIDCNNSQEAINSKITKIKYQEKWTTKEQRSETTYTGTGKKRKSHTRYYHVTETHGPYYTGEDDTGRDFNLRPDEYQKYAKSWKNEKHVGTHYGSAAFGSFAITGKIYEAYWNNDFYTIFPAVRIQTYENKVRSTNSIFKYSTPTEEQKSKYERKNIGNCYLSFDGVNIDNVELLARVNAFLGVKKQVHVVTIACKQGIGVCTEMLNVWRGPNKNELLVFIGVNDNKINWIKAFSWVDNTTIHTTIETDLVGKEFKADTLVKSYVPAVNSFWKRKEFKDFDYLQKAMDEFVYPAAIIFFVLYVIGYLIFTKFLKENYSYNY